MILLKENLKIVMTLQKEYLVLKIMITPLKENLVLKIVITPLKENQNIVMTPLTPLKKSIKKIKIIKKKDMIKRKKNMTKTVMKNLMKIIIERKKRKRNLLKKGIKIKVMIIIKKNQKEKILIHLKKKKLKKKGVFQVIQITQNKKIILMNQEEINT